MSEEQKIIDLENEIIFLKDVLSEKQKEIEEKNVAINKMSKDISRQLKEIEELKAITQNYNAIGGETFGDDRIVVCSMKYFDDGYFKKNYIFKDKIEEKIKHYNNELEHIKNGEEFENEEPMYYWGKVALEVLLEEN